jgi:hypothetical protein
VDDDGVVHFDADAHEPFVTPRELPIDDGRSVRGNTNHHATPAIARKATATMVLSTAWARVNVQKFRQAEHAG